MQSTSLKTQIIGRIGFDWSLKPLFILMIFPGIDLGSLSPFKRSPFLRNTAILILSLLLLLWNVIINSPRILAGFKFMRDENFGCERSAWECINVHTELLVIFGYQIAVTIAFFTIPIIHIVFFSTTFLPQYWRKLWITAKEIEREIKLSEMFHGVCRKTCEFALLLLLLVQPYVC